MNKQYINNNLSGGTDYQVPPVFLDNFCNTKIVSQNKGIVVLQKMQNISVKIENCNTKIH